MHTIPRYCYTQNHFLQTFIFFYNFCEKLFYTAIYIYFSSFFTYATSQHESLHHTADSPSHKPASKYLFSLSHSSSKEIHGPLMFKIMLNKHKIISMTTSFCNVVAFTPCGLSVSKKQMPHASVRRFIKSILKHKVLHLNTAFSIEILTNIESSVVATHSVILVPSYLFTTVVEK